MSMCMCLCVCVLDIMLNDKCLLCRDYCAFQLPIRIICVLRYISKLIFFRHIVQCTLYTIYICCRFFFRWQKKNIAFYAFDRVCVLSHCFAHVSSSIDAAKTVNYINIFFARWCMGCEV